MTSTLLQSDAFGPIHALQVFGDTAAAAVAGVHAVFVHGADRTLQTAAHWTPHLSKVVQHCGCASATAIDLPGHGASPPAPPAPAPPHAAKVAAIDGALRVLQQNASGKLRFLLVGRSLGGRMALEAAAHSAERVAGLVLVAPAVSPEALQQLRHSPGGEAALRLPAVLLWAEDDPIVPFAWAEPLRTAMPNARLVNFGRVLELRGIPTEQRWRAHIPENEFPERFHAEIRELVSALQL